MESLDRDGFATAPDVIDDATIDALLRSVEDSLTSPAVRARRTQVYAIRNLLSENQAVRNVANAPAIRSIVGSVLGLDAFAVRAIWFDKTPDANWKVAWHQDLSIAVRDRRDLPGFGPWSVKAGIVHVQPPVHVLERMITLRLHLDECNADNGPLKVLPGSHAHGVLSPAEIEQWRTTNR